MSTQHANLFLLVSLIAVHSSALHSHKDLGAAQADRRTVLILGDSVDRHAIEDSFETRRARTKHIEAEVVYDEEHQVSLGYVFHPGVGYNGDMFPPFFGTHQDPKQSTGFIIKKKSIEFSTVDLGTATPDLVIVGSALWDLAGWRQNGGDFPTTSRLQQWCDQDLPRLLSNVSSRFPSSRVVFRTNPVLRPGNNLDRFNNEGIEGLYKCIQTSTVGGKLFGQYEVIDYHEIMEKLLRESANDADKISSFWCPDSYHPQAVPGRLYVNEILKLIGSKPLDLANPRRMLKPDESFMHDDFDDANLN